jgi:hypothetical protein
MAFAAAAALATTMVAAAVATPAYASTGGSVRVCNYYTGDSSQATQALIFYLGGNGVLTRVGAVNQDDCASFAYPDGTLISWKFTDANGVNSAGTIYWTVGEGGQNYTVDVIGNPVSNPSLLLPNGF